MAAAVLFGLAGCEATPGQPHVRGNAPPPARLARFAGPHVPPDRPPAVALGPSTAPAVTDGGDTTADPLGIGLIVVAFAGVVLTVTTIDHRARPSRPTRDHRRATPAGVADGGAAARG